MLANNLQLNIMGKKTPNKPQIKKPSPKLKLFILYYAIVDLRSGCSKFISTKRSYLTTLLLKFLCPYRTHYKLYTWLW